MAIKVNLIPPEHAVSSSLSKLLKTTRSLGIIFLAGFLLFAAGVSAFFLISSLSLRSLQEEISLLETQIKDQEASEQQIVLLKDRIAKINAVLKLPDSTENLISIDPFLPSSSANSLVNELSVNSQKIDLSVNIRSNADLTAFLKGLSESGMFKSIVLSSFGFNPVGGYLVSVSVVPE